MRRPWMRLLWMGLLVGQAIANPLCGSGCARGEDGPRIKFLDDLIHPCTRDSENDPYEERIETERHDFTQSTVTVGRGVFQLETGYTYYYKDEADEREGSHATPELMLRLGLTEDIEFRVRWTNAWRFIDGEESLHGAEDLRWSLKFRTTDQEGCIPESALVPRFSVPSAGETWSTGRVNFGLDYIYGWEIAEGWEIYGSTGCDQNGLADFGLIPDEPANSLFNAWHQSVALGIELTETATAYHEWVGLFSTGLEEEFSVHFYNIGIDYYVNDNFILDVRVGVGLSSDADDFFSGVGGGYRF